MIDLPPMPVPLVLAVLGWGAAVLGLTWRASSKLSDIESRLSHVEKEVPAVSTLRESMARVEARLDGQDKTLERIEKKLDAR